MPSLFVRLARFLAVAILFVSGGATAIVLDCAGGSLSPGGTGVEDVQIKTPCVIKKGTHLYRNVNIYSDAANATFGDVSFEDGKTDFWAQSIIVESGGTLRAGVPTAAGAHKGPLTIWLWGQGYANGVKGIGASCVMVFCGVLPATTWTNGVHGPGNNVEVTLPGVFAPPRTALDLFYKYDPLPYDDGNASGYFGYKVLGVGWGGSILLYGKKGATYTTLANDNSGTSWARLAKTVTGGSNLGEIELDRAVDWEAGDEVVLTTTDYLPGHSEQLTITAVVSPTKFKVKRSDGALIKYTHVGTRFPLPAEMVSKLVLKDPQGADVTSMENRAAVALLSRSITIRSAGAKVGDSAGGFPEAPGNFIGGHTIVRQGVKQYQIQGVEFKQLGQGGRIGHYPVHFHMARNVPDDTYVKDSSINESMTRWFVLHGTHYVTLQRNVGWKSIGHGYYLEDGTEVHNNLYANIGIWARPAITDTGINPRQVPGILAALKSNGLNSDNMSEYKQELVPFYSDYDHPALFWIMNGWNDFEGNLAVGAGGCGVCYWLLPGAISGHSRHATWKGYASLQARPPTGDPTGRAGLTPLKRFVGNYCSTAAMSFLTTADTTACYGMGGQTMVNPDKSNQPIADSVPNPLAPKPCIQSDPHKKPPNDTQLEPYACDADGLVPAPPPATFAADDYYPKIGGGGRFPTHCDEATDCSTVPPCGAGNLTGCMVTVIDRYTSSFHFAETNFAAIWLRPQWYLLSNSFLTDVQNGGLTFVTGGGYTSSDVVPGHWALVWKTAFIGQTQDANPFASAASPVNPNGGLACATRADGSFSGNHCLLKGEGVSLPISNFGMNQRMFSIYDGPAYQDSNGYLKIKPVKIDDCSSANCFGASKYLAGRVLGLPKKGDLKGDCYMPNAAIAWKQPNGFYYPPAFHSTNLYFDPQVEIRHFVLQPLFNPGTYITNTTEVAARYCNSLANMYDNWTDVDRQTELNDDDGSLTGWINTISVNEDPFFFAPREGFECASDVTGVTGTAKTSPYDYVTTVVYPKCASTTPETCPDIQNPRDPKNPLSKVNSWAKDCTNQTCAGVPLYRQYLTGSEKLKPPVNPPQIRMAGQATYQRSTLTVNNGLYYIDTTPGADRQMLQAKPQRDKLNVFVGGEIYYTFLLFAKPATKQTYQLYVGTNFNSATDFVPVRVDVSGGKPVYTPTAMPAGWSVTPPDSKGVITVTMDMGGPGGFFETDYKNALKNRCGPQSFCSLSGNACSCATVTDPITQAVTKKDPLCQDAVCAWASKDTECPEGGCYGFGFKLPANFQTEAPNVRPGGACFPKTMKVNGNDVPSPWITTTWQPATDAVAGPTPLCAAYPHQPDNFCADAPPPPPGPPVGK